MRTLLLAAIFTLGIASMFALYKISNFVADNMERKLISYGANILITPRQETLKISYGGYALGDVTVEEHPINLDAALKAIDAVELRANIAVIAPKMVTMARISGQAAALVGVDWERELQLKAYWEVLGAFPEAGSADILAGAIAARQLGLAPGQVLNIGGREFQLSGVLRPTGSDDDTVLFIPLPVVQDMTGKPGRISFMEVAALCSGCPIEDIVNQLQAALPESEVRALAQIAESRMYSVHFAQNLAFSVSLVILVTACAMLIMSMLSSVAERCKEIGIMRAVGFSRRSVFLVFVSEALGIGAAAGASGYALGQALTAYVLQRLHLAEEANPAFEPAGLSAIILAAALTAGLSAAFPAWRASLVEPAEALVSL
ncbi:MAG: FtsX-like permease family protein [Deltaproteobacteria bacterium]|nr:FtsX-like permease family protein [Deltaproteobacteria bacterium]